MNPNHRNPVQRLSCGRLFHSALILSVIILLSGCALSPDLQTVQTDYDPKTEARIRVYSLSRTFLFPGRSCYSANDENIISIKEAPLFVTRQRDIGMPKRGGTATFHEYVIPANQPLTIVSMRGRSRRWLNAPPSNQASSTSRRTYCGPVAITFIPQPGEDYEAFFGTSLGRNRYCFIRLQRLTQISETHLKVEDVNFEEAGLCP
jgi:hypothetical protein